MKKSVLFVNVQSSRPTPFYVRLLKTNLIYDKNYITEIDFLLLIKVTFKILDLQPKRSENKF
jgi:hypothetical protein